MVSERLVMGGEDCIGKETEPVKETREKEHPSSVSSLKAGLGECVRAFQRIRMVETQC